MSKSLMFSSPTKGGVRASVYPSNFQRLSATGQNDLSFTSNISEITASRKAFDASEYLSEGITESDVHQFKQVFDLIDQTNEGFLNPGKIRNAMKKYGNYSAGLQLIYEIQSNFDNNLDGKIDFDEFVRMMKMKPCQQDSVDDIKNIFEQMTNYSNEGITPEDLIELAQNCGDDLSYEDAVNIIKKFDPEGKQISMKKFIEFNKRCEF